LANPISNAQISPSDLAYYNTKYAFYKVHGCAVDITLTVPEGAMNTYSMRTTAGTTNNAGSDYPTRWFNDFCMCAYVAGPWTQTIPVFTTPDNMRQHPSTMGFTVMRAGKRTATIRVYYSTPAACRIRKASFTNDEIIPVTMGSGTTNALQSNFSAWTGLSGTWGTYNVPIKPWKFVIYILPLYDPNGGMKSLEDLYTPSLKFSVSCRWYTEYYGLIDDNWIDELNNESAVDFDDPSHNWKNAFGELVSPSDPNIFDGELGAFETTHP